MPDRHIANWSDVGNHSYFPQRSAPPSGLAASGQRAGSRPRAGYPVAGRGVAKRRPKRYPVAGTLAAIRAQHKPAR
jgi:hypothetical protein